MAIRFGRLKPMVMGGALLASVSGISVSTAYAQDPLSRFLNDIFNPEPTTQQYAPSPEPETELPLEDLQPQSEASVVPQDAPALSPPEPPARPSTLSRGEAPSIQVPGNTVEIGGGAENAAVSAEQEVIARPLPPLPPVRPAGIGEVAAAPVSPAVAAKVEPASVTVTQVAQTAPIPRTDAEAVERVSAYLNGINTLTARFLQTGADRRQVGGTLYVQRPGRLRFAYDPPSTLEIVADGRSVAVRDAKLRTNDVYSIGQTPLKFLLRDNVDLSRDVKVRDVQIDQRGTIKLTLEDSATLGGTSTVTLRFDARANVLRGWMIVDPQGYETNVALSEVQVVKR